MEKCHVCGRSEILNPAQIENFKFMGYDAQELTKVIHYAIQHGYPRKDDDSGHAFYDYKGENLCAICGYMSGCVCAGCTPKKDKCVKC